MDKFRNFIGITEDDRNKWIQIIEVLDKRINIKVTNNEQVYCCCCITRIGQILRSETLVDSPQDSSRGSCPDHEEF